MITIGRVYGQALANFSVITARRKLLLFFHFFLAIKTVSVVHVIGMNGKEVRVVTVVIVL